GGADGSPGARRGVSVRRTAGREGPALRDVRRGDPRGHGRGRGRSDAGATAGGTGREHRGRGLPRTRRRGSAAAVLSKESATTGWAGGNGAHGDRTGRRRNEGRRGSDRRGRSRPRTDPRAHTGPDRRDPPGSR